MDINNLYRSMGTSEAIEAFNPLGPLAREVIKKVLNRAKADGSARIGRIGIIAGDNDQFTLIDIERPFVDVRDAVALYFSK